MPCFFLNHFFKVTFVSVSHSDWITPPQSFSYAHWKHMSFECFRQSKKALTFWFCVKVDSQSVMSCWWKLQTPNSPIDLTRTWDDFDRKDATICSAKKFRARVAAGLLCKWLHKGHRQLGREWAVTIHCSQKLWPQFVTRIGGRNISKIRSEVFYTI